MPSPRHSAQRNKRADRINARGINMSLPCARCFRKHLECLILKGARRCGECHRSNVACEIDPLSEQQWDHIKERENRLKTEMAEATQAILENSA